MTTDERATLTNMVAEIGGFAGLGLATATGMLLAVKAREKALGRSAREDEFEPINWRALQGARGFTAEQALAARAGFDQAGRHHGPQVGHEADAAGGLHGVLPQLGASDLQAGGKGGLVEVDAEGCTTELDRLKGDAVVADNVTGHIFVSWLHPYKEHKLVLVGSKGMLSFEDSAPERKILFYEKGIDWVQGKPVKRDGPTEAISCGGVSWLERSAQICSPTDRHAASAARSRGPPRRNDSRMRELYAYLFGAQLPDESERAAAKAARNDSVEFGSSSDLGIDEDPASIPWWRRNKAPSAGEPAFDSPVISREPVTEVIAPVPSSPVAEDEFGIDLLEDLLKAEEAVKRFTGEVETGATGLREDGPGLLPGFVTKASEKGEAGEFDGAVPTRPKQPTAVYRMPAASLLTPGTPPKKHSAANDEVVAAITEVLKQFQVDAHLQPSLDAWLRVHAEQGRYALVFGLVRDPARPILHLAGGSQVSWAYERALRQLGAASRLQVTPLADGRHRGRF